MMNLAVPDLAKLLQSSKTPIAEKASDVVYRLSQKPAERAGLVQPEMLEALTAEIKKGRHGEQAKLVAAVHNLSKTVAGKEGLFKARDRN